MMRCLLGVLILFSISCFDDVVVGPGTINGAYTLRTINGATLPYSFDVNATTKKEIVDDVITLFSGSTYARTGHARTTVGGQTTNETSTESGSYSPLGTSVTLNSSSGGRSTVATIDGNTMTLVEPGLTWVFKK